MKTRHGERLKPPCSLLLADERRLKYKYLVNDDFSVYSENQPLCVCWCLGVLVGFSSTRHTFVVERAVDSNNWGVSDIGLGCE